MKTRRLRPPCERQKAILIACVRRLQIDLQTHERHGYPADQATLKAWLEDVTATLGKVTGR